MKKRLAILYTIAFITFSSLAGVVVADAAVPAGKGAITLPGSVDQGPFSEIVLFGFDDWAFPFRTYVETRLFTGKNAQIVLRPGPAGSHDETILYYGTVIKIGEVFHMWYNGNYGPLSTLTGMERKKCVLAYATSNDGIHWEKPNLGLVEFNGSKSNNIVDFPVPSLWSTAAILYDPEEPDASRRFKMAYEAKYDDGNKFSVAFSPDGLRWVPSPKNPIGPFLEMAGVTKHRGLYYVYGQTSLVAHHSVPVRRLVTFVSADFEHWSQSGAVGLDRGPDVTGPSYDDKLHQFEEVHLGAGIWNRGNVMLGIYGQWHGHPSGDRRLTGIDLGLVVSHDAIHFYEPIRDFRLVPAREQAESPTGVVPALTQGQGMENVGDRTLYWYSLWRGNTGSGVRVVSWPRDRLGALQPFRPVGAQAISCPIEINRGKASVYINASGLGEFCRLRIGLLDEGFRPIEGYAGADQATMSENGFGTVVEWKGGRTLPVGKTVRLSISFEGARPENGRLYAVYVRELSP